MPSPLVSAFRAVATIAAGSVWPHSAAGTFQEVQDWFGAPFTAKITDKAQFGERWYYAFTEQIALNNISDVDDVVPDPLYEDHFNPRVGVLPPSDPGILDTNFGGPYLTEVNNRELQIGDLVRVWYKCDTTEGPLYECSSGTGAGGPRTGLQILITPPSIPTGVVGQIYHQKIMATLLQGADLTVGVTLITGGPAGTGTVLTAQQGVLQAPPKVGTSADGNLFTRSNAKPAAGDLGTEQGQMWFKES